MQAYKMNKNKYHIVYRVYTVLIKTRNDKIDYKMIIL